MTEKNPYSFLISSGPVAEEDKYSKTLAAGSFNCLWPRAGKVKGLQSFENDQMLILSHSDVNFRKCVNVSEMVDVTGQVIRELALKLGWGFIMVIYKQDGEMLLVNDVYGIYPIYYSNTDDNFIISGDGDTVIRKSGCDEFDTEALYEYFLFNYTLNGRTLIKGINQLTGGCCIRYSKVTGKLSVEKNMTVKSFLSPEKKKNRTEDDLAGFISQNISSGLDEEYSVSLPLSGGFDSKLLLAALLSLGIKPDTFTFGAENSTDHQAALLTSGLLGLPHRLLNTESAGDDSLERKAKEFVRRSPLLPLILDLLAYEDVRNMTNPSNIVIGAMGGELINGPVIVSEVILTRSACSLTGSPDISTVKERLSDDLSFISFLNKDLYRSIDDSYFQSLGNYFTTGNRDYWNLTEFLLNETYSKFFGVVFKTLYDKHNLIFPFVDREFLKRLIGSEYRYTRHRPFTKNPFNHLRSRMLYARIVKRLEEKVLFTPLDRNYMMADLLYPQRFISAVRRYLENHLLGKNKNDVRKTLNFTKWLKPALIDKLKDSGILNLDIVNREEVIRILRSADEGKHVPDFILRKLILLLSLHYVAEEYSVRIN